MTTNTVALGDGVTVTQSLLGLLGVQIDPVVKRQSRRQTKAVAKQATRTDRHAARRTQWQEISDTLETL